MRGVVLARADGPEEWEPQLVDDVSKCPSEIVAEM